MFGCLFCIHVESGVINTDMWQAFYFANCYLSITKHVKVIKYISSQWKLLSYPPWQLFMHILNLIDLGFKLQKFSFLIRKGEKCYKRSHVNPWKGFIHFTLFTFISCYLGFLAFRSSTVPCNGDDIIIYANIMAVVEKRGGGGCLAPTKNIIICPP